MTEHSFVVKAEDVIWIEVYEPSPPRVNYMEHKQPYTVVVKESSIPDDIREGTYARKNGRVPLRSAYPPRVIVDKDEDVSKMTARINRAVVENKGRDAALRNLDLNIVINRAVIEPNDKHENGAVFLNLISIEPIL